MTCPDASDDKCINGSCFRTSDTPGWPCEQAFDDNVPSSWVSNADDVAGLGYALPSPEQIQRLTLVPPQVGTDYLRCPTVFQLRAQNSEPSDYSSEGSLILSVSEPDNFFDGKGKQVWDFYNDNSYTHYWLYMTDKGGEFGEAWEYGICEMELITCVHPPYKLSGTVKEKGVPVIRIVRSYIRSTGELYASVYSAADGSFSVQAIDDTTDMFVIAFDDALGDQYNALIYDRVKGVLT